MKQSVIIIGKADVIKLGLIRSLGEIGCRIIVIQLMNVRPRVKPLDYYSRYVDAYHFAKPENIVTRLIEKCTEQGQRPIVFALDDQSVCLLDSAYDQLSPYFTLPNIDQRQGGIVAMMNKMEQKRLAQKAGLLVPKGWEIPFVNGQYEIPSDIAFPCFVKGLIAYHNTKSLQRKCNDIQELKELLNKCSDSNHFPLMAEELVPIDNEVGVMAMSFETTQMVPAIIEKTAVGKGTSNGVTLSANTIPLDDSNPYSHSLKRFLKSLRYTGIINIDFIQSHGHLYFLEVNFRYAAYGYAITCAGVNLPAILVRCLCGEKHEDLPKALQARKSFINEKIGLMNVVEGYMTYSQYRSIKRNVDFGIVTSQNDPSPYRHFFARFIFKYMMSKILKR